MAGEGPLTTLAGEGNLGHCFASLSTLCVELDRQRLHCNVLVATVAEVNLLRRAMAKQMFAFLAPMFDLDWKPPVVRWRSGGAPRRAAGPPSWKAWCLTAQAEAGHLYCSSVAACRESGTWALCANLRLCCQWPRETDGPRPLPDVALELAAFCNAEGLGLATSQTCLPGGPAKQAKRCGCLRRSWPAPASPIPQRRWQHTCVLTIADR